MTALVMLDSAIAAISAALGMMILSREPRNAAYQSFFFLTVGIALSALAKSFFWGSGDFFAHAVAKGGFEMVVLGAFLASALGTDGKFRRWFIALLIPWFALFVALPLLLVAASLRGDPAAFFWQTYRDIGPLITVVMAFYLVAAYFFYFRRSAKTFGFPVFLTRGLTLVMIVSASIMCAADLVLPFFGVFRFAAISNFFALVIIIMGGYGVLRYGMSGGTLFRRGASYSISLLLVAVFFFGMEFAIEKFFYRNDRIADVVTAAIGALAFLSLRDFFNGVTDRIFFRNSYPFFVAVKELEKRLDAPLGRGELSLALADFFNLTIRPTETVLFGVRRSDEKIEFISGLPRESRAIKDYGSFVDFFIARGICGVSVMDATQFFRGDRARKRDDANGIIEMGAAHLGIAAIVPILVRGEIRMVALVGRKRSGALFNKDDVELLAFVAERAGVALENIELREDMEEQVRKFDERVLAQTEKLKDICESQSCFLADVSHEFKTPLAILKMHAGAFSGSEDPDQKKAWCVMDATLDRLTRLVGGFLDAVKKDVPSAPVHEKSIMIAHLLRDACDDCSVLFEDKGVALSVASTEMLSVSGESDRLKEVILNLLSNALRHTPAGGSVSLVAREADGGAEIIVSDTGSGIPAENIPHIFERFYRIGESPSSVGTGIGLYLCRQIIRDHRGTISAESAVGKGSRFIVRLPLLPAVAAFSERACVSVTDA